MGLILTMLTMLTIYSMNILFRHKRRNMQPHHNYSYTCCSLS